MGVGVGMSVGESESESESETADRGENLKKPLLEIECLRLDFQGVPPDYDVA